MSGDPLRDADRRDDREYRALSRYPKCCFCGHPIQSETMVEIDDGQYACEECVQGKTVYVDDWVNDNEVCQ